MEYLTAEQLAKRLHCKSTKLWQMRRERKLPKPIEFGRTKLWLSTEVDEFLAKQRAAY